MNKNIRALAEIAQKKQRRIIGLMSGTSLDGLDIAVCSLSGAGIHTEITVEDFETIPYWDPFREKLRGICFKENSSLKKLTLFHKEIAETHARLVNIFLETRNIDKTTVDLIASHGQTLYHIPAGTGTAAATLQAGDGDHLAVQTGIITVSDFRQKNIAGGGQGAPLAAYGDLLLFKEKDTDVMLLNIGGIANFTYLPAEGPLICSDTGPGNALMNAWMHMHFPGKDFDEDGVLAAKGHIIEPLLAALKDHPFFHAVLPKTTGPELFNISFVENILTQTGNEKATDEDIMASLNKFTADTIAEAVKKVVGEKKYKLYVSGGGIHNPVLIRHLEETLPGATFLSVTEKGIPPDAKEAVLFALLANECVAGDPGSFNVEGANLPAVSMGKISFPY